MRVLRWAFVGVAIGVCVYRLAVHGQWEGRLQHGRYQTWIIVLPKSPIWSPPPLPAYSDFAAVFDNDGDLPDEFSTPLVIERRLRFAFMYIDTLLWLWPVTLLAGIGYCVMRNDKRDWILYSALCIGTGLSSAVACSIVLWITLGGWGPPAPAFLGTVGLVAGAVATFVSFRPKHDCFLSSRRR